ncbi:CBS domain-containing protein [Desulfococcus sp.]|uniref:CBS domain-containing protein n=1 Tax=Desulfococcus sp. TaxID=2025834 RepID=UPI0035942B33
MQIITTHKNTDFDGFASLIAGTVLYPGAVPVIPRNINPNVKSFLAIHKDLFDVRTVDDIELEKVTSLVVVDVNQWHRLDDLRKVRAKPSLEVILWDHHPDKGDISANWVRHEPMGANITLMVRQMRHEGKSITPIHATLFLTGLHEDTGSFMFPSTRAEDAVAAAYLMDAGADLNVVGSLLRPAYGEKQKNVLFEMLKSGERETINGFKVSFHKVDIEGHVGSLSVVTQMCREILNVDAVFGIFTGQKKGKSIVIGRSGADGPNVGTLLRSLGGGGHPGAGSAMADFVNPDTIQEMISDLIRGNQQASVQISDLMSFPVTTIAADAPMSELRKLLRENGCTGVPVVEDDRLVGVISRRDFKKVRNNKGLKAPVKAFMSKDIKTIEPGRSPMQAARLMVKHDIGRLPVVEDDRIIGIVTRSDVMLYFYDMLPD